MIEVDLDIYTASNGRKTVLKEPEEVQANILRLTRQIQRTKSHLENATETSDRIRFEATLDQYDEEMMRLTEYFEKLPTWKEKSETVKYAVEVPPFGVYRGYLDQAKSKDTDKAPGRVDMAKLMDIVLPKHTLIEDAENPSGYRKMTPAEFLDKDKGVPPYIAEVLWSRLFLSINPDASSLPDTPFPS